VLQVADRVGQRPGPAIEIAGQAMGLRLVRAHLEDGPHLAQRAVRVSIVEERLRQDESRRHVVRKALEPFPQSRMASRTRPVLRYASARGAKRQRGRIPGQRSS